jgi:hypothetical protein
LLHRFSYASIQSSASTSVERTPDGKDREKVRQEDRSEEVRPQADAKNRRMIKADAALKPVFGGKATVNMFEMTKLVNKHLKK